MHRRKVIGIVAAVAGGCLAVSGVYATSLIVGADEAAQGSTAVSSCDSDGVTVRNGDVTSHDDGYVVNTVVVTGISSNCEGQDLMVTATDKDQQALETADSVTIEAPSGEDNSTVVSFANRDVAVDDLDGYTVAIVDHGVA